MIFDCETALKIPEQVCYDIGFAVIDRHGEVYEEHSYCVKETFGDLRLMNTAYYSWKFQSYIEALLSGETELKSYDEIMAILNDTILRYNIDTICAYNLAFDLRALDNTRKYFNFFDEWNVRDLNHLDIWGFACEVLFKDKFINTAIKNGWLTEKGNIKTNAECAYRYISSNNHFDEAHMALQDVKIESDILLQCFRQKKPYSKHIIHNPWQIVQKYRQEIGA